MQMFFKVQKTPLFVNSMFCRCDLQQPAIMHNFFYDSKVLNQGKRTQPVFEQVAVLQNFITRHITREFSLGT